MARKGPKNEISGRQKKSEKAPQMPQNCMNLPLKMLKFVFGRGASPPWTPHLGTVSGLHRPLHPGLCPDGPDFEENGPDKALIRP